jgi:hypothetical protein
MGDSTGATARVGSQLSDIENTVGSGLTDRKQLFPIQFRN